MSLVSLYDEASLWMTPSGAKDGKLFSELPVPEYGPEEVANGDFATDSDWTKESGWTISGGSANCLNGQGVSIYQTNVLDIGKYYKLTFTVSNYSQGFLGSIGNDFGGVVADTYGSYEIFGTATSTFFGFSAFGNFIGSIDNVSVKEVIKGDGDFTFTRGSNLAATRVGPTGLIEKGRENLLAYSNDFEEADWLQVNTTRTSGQSGYDGSSNAWKIEATSTGTIRLRQLKNISANSVITMSLYAKIGNVDFIKFNLLTSGTNSIATFDLTDGTTYSSNAIDEKWESVGNGWVRISATFTNSLQITEQRIEVRSEYDLLSAPAGSFVYIQDAQVESGLAATDYIESGATTGKAGLLEDEPRFDYSGGATCPSLLLEPSRTNLVTQSEYFGSYSKATSDATAVPVVTDNYAISPEGLQNAARVVVTKPSTDNDYAFIREAKTITKTSGDKMSQSVYLKATDASQIGKIVDIYAYDGSYLSVTNHTLTNEWERVEAIHTASIGTSNTEMVIGKARAYAGGTTLANMATDFLVYGHQFENNASYPTSYIPNHSGGSVTRGADSCSVTGVSSLIGQTEGTLFMDVNLSARDSYSYFALAPNLGSSSSYIGIGITAAAFSFEVVNSGVQVAYNYLNSSTGNFKIAFAYKANDFVGYVNGTQVMTDTSGSVPACSQIGLNNYDKDQPFLYKQALLFKERLTNAELAALTQL